MKRILCILCLLLAFASNAFAENATIKNVTSTHSLKINQPIITLENKDAAEEINRFISKKVLAYKKVFNNNIGFIRIMR